VIYTLGYVVFYINMLWLRALYALGITSFSLYISVLSAVLNVGGNLLTVLVFDLGVAGLAISTLFSSLAASVCYLIILRRAFREMPTEELSHRFSGALVCRTLRFSMPVAIQKMAFLGISFVIAPAINALGAAATTGYGVANQLYSIGTMTIWAATSAFSCYTAQCVGEGDTKKIRRGVRVGLEINAALLLPVVLGISVLAGPIVSIFFPDGYEGEAYTDFELASVTTNVDIIVGGHSHTQLKEYGKTVNPDGRKVIIVTDGKWGLNIGKLTVK
jgi:Na+-driven multidrug efflux pump